MQLFSCLSYGNFSFLKKVGMKNRMGKQVLDWNVFWSANKKKKTITIRETPTI